VTGLSSFWSGGGSETPSSSSVVGYNSSRVFFFVTTLLFLDCVLWIAGCFAAEEERLEDSEMGFGPDVFLGCVVSDSELPFINDLSLGSRVASSAAAVAPLMCNGIVAISFFRIA
jgi:hypothetical protein